MKFFQKLEHMMSLVLVGLMAIVVVLAALELGVTIVRDVASPPILFLGIGKLLDIFGKFLLVLIGIELLETMRIFAEEGALRAKIVLTVAMIAMARKVIVFEPEHFSPMMLVGMAAVLVALSVAYKLFANDDTAA